jgi:hypothetical protein
MNKFLRVYLVQLAEFISSSPFHLPLSVMRSALSKTSVLLLVFAIGTGMAAPSHAQNVGIGGQLGEPSGVTLKFYNANAPSYDFLAAWSLQADTFLLNGHLLFENRIPTSNLDKPLEWFVGPGAFVGLSEDGALGISGTIGLNLILTDHISIYGRITPRLALAPDTEEDVGGGLGIRYFFD